MLNALCIDADDFYTCLNELNYSLSEKKYLIDKEMEDVLKTLDILKIKSSFFIPGHFFKKSKHLLKRIIESGHHVCSHGNYHSRLDKLSKKNMLIDLKISKNSLEDFIGLEVDTYKAPAWSVTKQTELCLDSIAEAGFKFDHSCSPSALKNIKQYYDIDKYLYKNTLKIIPPTSINIFGFQSLFCGGFYNAHVPFFITKYFYKNLNKERKPFNFFFHPYEFSPNELNKKLYKYKNLKASLYGLHLGRYNNFFRKLNKYFLFGTLKSAYSFIY
jgi:hypothetical protein